MKRINRIAVIINKFKILALICVIFLNIENQDSENSGIDKFQIYSAFIFLKYVYAACTLSNYNVGFYTASTLTYNSLQSTSPLSLQSRTSVFSINCYYSFCNTTLQSSSSSSCNSFISVTRGGSYFDTINFGLIASSTICQDYTCQYKAYCDARNVGNTGTLLGKVYSNAISINLNGQCSSTTCYASSSASNPNSYSVIQNSGTQKINSQSSVLITQYFQIPGTLCMFSSCSMYQGTTLDSSVTVSYSGSGSTATVIFKISTSSPFATKNLNLRCVISGTTTPVFSSNTIAFTVSPCFTEVIPSARSYIYQYNQNSGSVQETNLLVSKYFTGQSSTCYFQSCDFYDSSQTKSTRVTVLISGSASSQLLTFKTTTLNAFTLQNLYLKCLVATSSSIYASNSNSISFTVNPCSYSSNIPSPSSFTYSYNQSSGSVVSSSFTVSNLFSGLQTGCYFLSCQFLSGSSASTKIKATLIGTGISQNILFTTNTQNAFTVQALQLQCQSTDQKTALNTYSIQFTVNSCNNQILNPTSKSYSYLKNQNGGQVQSSGILISNYFSGVSSACYFQSCVILDSSANPSAYVTAALQDTGTSQQLIFSTNTQSAFNMLDLQLKCLSTDQTYVTNTYKISFTVIDTTSNAVDCNDDDISIIQVFPDNSDPNQKYYISKNNYPVLKINQTYDSQFNANLKNRFTNILSKQCPINNFKIEKLICDNQEQKDFSSYLTISSSGVFQVLKSQNNAINNCQVYIKAFNTKKWGGHQQQYLVDVSLYQNQKSTNNQKTQAINLKINQNQQDSMKFTIPNLNANTSNIYLSNQNELDFLNLTFNPSNQSISLKIDEDKIMASGEYALDIKTINNKGVYQFFKFKFYFDKKKIEIVSASIASLDQYGFAIVKFSEQMILNQTIPWINYTKQNLLPFNNSWINQSNTVLKVLPALGRDSEEGFNQSSLNLNWNVTKITNTSIYFQIKFENPLEISPLFIQDKLQIVFNGSQYLFASQSHNKTIDRQSWKIKKNIIKQITSDSQTQSLSLFGGYMNLLLLIVTIVCIFLNIIGQGCLEYMLLMFRSLQIILHLPILQVVFPKNVIIFFKLIFSLVQFDILDKFPIFEYLSLFVQYDKNEQPKVIEQMIDFGYDNRNAFYGLKTLTIVLFLYFVRVFLSLCTGFYIAYKGWKNKYLNKAHYYLAQGLYFNQIIRISMEAYYEFFLVGYMNYQTLKFNFIGEKLGALETFFVLFMILIVLTSLSILILFKTKKQLEEKGNRNLKYFIGEIYESTKIDNKFQKAYTLLFLLRRFSFLSIATFIQNQQYAAVQIVVILLMNLAWTIYIGFTKAQKEQLLNQIERVNELFVQFSTAILTLFTDYVQNKNIQYMYGWFMVASVSFHVSFNLFFIFRHVFKVIKYNFIKFYNYVNYLYDNKKKKIQSKDENIINEVDIIQKKQYVNFKQQQIDNKIKEEGNQKIQSKEIGFKLNKLNLVSNISIIKEEEQFTQNNQQRNQQQKVSAYVNSKKDEQDVYISQIQKTSKLTVKSIQKSTKKQIGNLDNLDQKDQKKSILLNKELEINKRKEVAKNTDAIQRYLENIRQKRGQFMEISNIKDTVQKKFMQLIKDNKEIFKSCEQKGNSYIQILKDFRFLSYNGNDTLIQIRTKEIQISLYSQYQLRCYSNLEDYQTAFQEFRSKLSLFTDQIILQIKQQ